MFDLEISPMPEGYPAFLRRVSIKSNGRLVCQPIVMHRNHATCLHIYLSAGQIDVAAAFPELKRRSTHVGNRRSKRTRSR